MTDTSGNEELEPSCSVRPVQSPPKFGDFVGVSFCASAILFIILPDPWLCLDAGTLGRTEKQNRANSSRQQHKSGASVGNTRDMTVSTSISILIFLSPRWVLVVIALVPSFAIVVAIRQHWENHGSGY
jgi:hypothetical protein